MAAMSSSAEEAPWEECHRRMKAAQGFAAKRAELEKFFYQGSHQRTTLELAVLTPLLLLLSSCIAQLFQTFFP